MNIEYYQIVDIKCLPVGQLQTNCYLLEDCGQLAIIDPGDDADIIQEEIVAQGGTPRYIINTHGHFDHTTANAALKKAFNIPVFIHEAEKDTIDFIPDKFLKSDDKIKIGGIELQVIHTPGHTKGGICLFGPGFVISGDTLFAQSIGRTDLPGGSDSDMSNSLKKIDNLLSTGTRIYPGHGPAFTYEKGLALVWLDYLL